MRLALQVQNASGADWIPAEKSVRRWARAALGGSGRERVELTVRVVDAEEGARLNQDYRHKAGPTNVLSFPFEDPPGVTTHMLGDLVVCAPVVEREAHEQDKALEAHWAHMVVHGVLHLCGYDHEVPAQAVDMESLETRILGELGYPDPYAADGEVLS